MIYRSLANSFAKITSLLNSAGTLWVFALMFLICADIVARAGFKSGRGLVGCGDGDPVAEAAQKVEEDGRRTGRDPDPGVAPPARRDDVVGTGRGFTEQVREALGRRRRQARRRRGFK